jgi:hypothetical protein
METPNMKIQTRAATGLLVLVLGLVLAACSGTSAAPTAAPTVAPGGQAGASAAPGGGATQSSAPAASTGSAAAIDACALVTEQQATAFLGSDPGPGVSTGTPDAPGCFYGSLGILVAPTDGQAEYTTKTSALQGTANFQTISGVGDGAGATIVANTVADMEFFKGNVGISVEVQGDPSLQNITAASLTMLGAAIASRL